MDAVTVIAEMTAAEFLARPGDPNGFRWELVDGEIVRRESPMAHNRAWGEMLFALDTWRREVPDPSSTRTRGCPNLGIPTRYDERNVYLPDVVWYRSGRVPSREDLPPYPVPDLVAQVRSPSWRFDIGVRKSIYERHGLPELWLVDTAAEAVLVFRRSDPQAPEFDVSLELTAADTLQSPLLPGFSLPVGEIFADH